MTKSTFQKESFSAGGIVANKKGEIVLVLMDNQHWSFPKGHINKGESTLDAARREVREETGIISSKFIKELGTYQRASADDVTEIKNISMFLFTTNETLLGPVAEDVTKAIWIDLLGASDLLSFQEDREFFKNIKGALVGELNLDRSDRSNSVHFS